ncbi:hypothetical protein, partial [Caldifermentibacillus hisashii]|uniref:hypothetical protein n=1 Tax=Caldifermentibacillus hisashii TaxID=996558 RepID=UPI0030EAF03E
ITVVGLGVTGKSFFVYAQKFSAGLCIFPLQSSALLFCHTQFLLYYFGAKTLFFYLLLNFVKICR